MADSVVERPIISALSISPSRASQTKGARRSYRRAKSAPTNEILPEKIVGIAKPTFLAKIHPGLRLVVLILVLYLGGGTLCFFFFKNHLKGNKTNGTLDAIYFCIVTMSTVGYGDLVPNSDAAKLLTCAFVFGGMAVVVLVLSKAADYLVEKQEKALVRALHFHQQVSEIDVLKEIKTKRVNYKLFVTTAFLLMLMVVGTVVLSRVEGLDLVDSFYCVCCTITTLGYGDKSFSTVAGRIFAVFWILTSTICLAQFFLCVAELSTEHRQRSLVKWVLTRRMTYRDIEAADLDNDGVVSAAEFIIYKLKEMGKLSPEDIALIMDEFDNQDVDQNGTLSKTDVTLAQYSEPAN